MLSLSYCSTFAGCTCWEPCGSSSSSSPVTRWSSPEPSSFGTSPGIIVSCRCNTLCPEKNGWHFTDDIFKCIFLNEKLWILNIISLQYVCESLIDTTKSRVVQVMIWGRQATNHIYIHRLIIGECWARNRHQGHGQVIASHRYSGM